MRTKRLKRVMTFALALCLMASFGCALAVEPRYQRITAITADLTIGTSGIATCYGGVELSNITDTAHLQVALEQKVNGVWRPYQSWSTTGDSGVDHEVTTLVPSGYYYKVVVTVNVYDSNDVLRETATGESYHVYYSA